ncbi:MAG: flagellin [Selenomonadaceae bacterium]|nr:flagellin [Selenomonadaceae bacterium]
MSLTIRYNHEAILMHRTMSDNQAVLEKSSEKVASAQRVTGAADDVSGYAISERMRGMIRDLAQDVRNTQNGNSLLNVAEGAVSDTVDILRVMQSKAIDAANDTNDDEDRAVIQKEYDQYIDQIDDNARVTFNGKTLADGSKNREGEATRTSLTNSMLSADTTDITAFTDMKNRQNENLGITEDDTIELSFVKQGETVTANVSGADNMIKLIDAANKAATEEEALRTKLNGKAFDTNVLSGKVVGEDTAGVTVGTIDGQNAITIRAQEEGVSGQIAGVAVKVLDSEAKIKKNATETLNSFIETVRAEDASDNNDLVIHTGPKANQNLRMYMTDMRSYALGLRGADGKTLAIGTRTEANAAIQTVTNALQKALDEQTRLGSYHYRLDYTSANLSIAGENVEASDNTIRGIDIAAQMVDHTKSKILAQSSTVMLAQSNNNASDVLTLLQ